MPAEPDPCVIVLYGASGDLTARKVIPALYDMFAAGALPTGTCVLGVSRSAMTDDGWRDHLATWAKKQARRYDPARWREFAQRLHYQAGDGGKPEVYPALSARIAELAVQHHARDNVLFYLAVGPALHEPIIHAIDGSGLVTEGRRWCTIDHGVMPWQRVIVEKPFGRDLDSAQSLNRALGRVFEEDAVYRIDHYLGKEIVQSLLVFRFANTIFEPLWNQQYIDHVQITAAEAVGAGTRAAFYDDVGAVRDMIQSHLLQVAALVAMEPPTSFHSHHIRQEKVKVIDAIEPIPAKHLGDFAVLGQYAGDDQEPAYHLNPDVAKGTATETFAAVHFRFNNWRWAGTPFYLRTGKRLATKRTEVFIQFKHPPANLFDHLHAAARPPNQIIIEIAPGGGVSLRFQGKVPGHGVKLDTVEMDFDYAERFGAEPVEAYGPLILDAMRGDQTLFQHRYEAEGAWRAVMPLIGPGSAPIRANVHANYAPGTWGPPQADALLARHGRAWHNPAAP